MGGSSSKPAEGGQEKWAGNPHGRKLEPSLKGAGKGGPRLTKDQIEERKIAEEVKKRQAKQDELEKRRQYMTLQISNLETQAKEKIIKGDKNGAKMSLNRKNMLVKQAENLDAQMATIEQQTFQIEAMKLNKEVVAALETGNEMQKDLAAQVNPDKVAEVVDQIAEHEDQQAEIADIFKMQANQLSDGVDLDDELAALQQQVADEKMLDVEAPKTAAPVPAAAQVPTAAAEVPTAAKTEEARVEDELAALQAQLLPN